MPFPATPLRSWASRSNKGEASKDIRMSLDVSKRRIDLGKIYVDDKESVGDEHRRDKSLGMSLEREGVGESKEGIGGA